MAAVVNIVLNDAQATPVAHTFIPLGPDGNGVWHFEDQSGTNPLGYNRITLSLQRPPPSKSGDNSATRMARVKVAISCPTLETLGTADNGITPPPTVAYVVRASLEFMIPERATLQNRKDIRKYIDFLAAETQLTAMVESLQNIF